MKKLTVIILIFAVLLSAGTVYMTAEVNAGKDKISFEEEVIYGDKIHANGVKFTMETNYERKLNWKTDYTIGIKPECKTDFRFSTEGIPLGYERDKSGISISSDLGNIKSISDKYAEIVKTAKKEKKFVSETFKLRDFCEYLPLMVDVDLPDVLLSEEKLQRLNDKVNEFFKTPVPEECEIIFHAESDGASGISCDLYISAYTATYTSDTVFFIYSKDIYSPYEKEDNCLYTINYGENEVYEDTLKLAYDPGDDFIINEVHSTDKTLVFLGTDKEHNKILLRVLDLKTMECIQNIQVSDENSESADGTVFLKDDFLQIEIYDYNSKANENDNETEMHFYTVLPDGTYKHSMTVYDKEKNLSKYDYLRYVDFDGERAVFMQAIHPYSTGNNEYYHFFVSVYDKSGLLYIGKYKCNLSKHIQGDYWLSDYDYYSLDINI